MYKNIKLIDFKKIHLKKGEILFENPKIQKSIGKLTEICDQNSWRKRLNGGDHHKERRKERKNQ